MPKRYNGWANYETWNVALWLGNDETLYLRARQFAQQSPRVTAAQARGFIKDVFPHGTPDTKGMSHVRYGEIARFLREL